MLYFWETAISRLTEAYGNSLKNIYYDFVNQLTHELQLKKVKNSLKKKKFA